MEMSTAASSSRVKVEYHDPHGIYPCIAGDLESRLPLQNLSWNSPQRPLRLINTLYVTLESIGGGTDPRLQDISQTRTDGPDDQPFGQSARKHETDSKSTRKERRHQIPGLRQTPYLKLLLLRCGDTETYKSFSRKEVRDWIKAHTPPSQKSSKSSNQENHDAFEWMILHVVMPGVDRRVSWPHRNSTKILSYLRDDFNGSSKSSIDRVAQVPSTRVSERDSSEDDIPDSTFGKQAGEAWDDTLSKFKQLILASFDQRVRQYEEDIKEKGAQRSLPGWNFCTFFVLKEGLARGFESVGLVEDALSGYDELHAELDAAVRCKYQQPDSSQDATMFRDATPEIQNIGSQELSEGNTKIFALFSQQVLDCDKKPYRDLILSSDISIFDFKTYIFARQITLLQRLGTTVRAGRGSGMAVEPRFLCEICQRATAFIASTGTILRNDGNSATRMHQIPHLEELQRAQLLVTMIVSCWTFSVALNILNITNKAVMGKEENSITRPSSAQSQTSNATEKPAVKEQNGTVTHSHQKSLLASQRAGITEVARRALQIAATTKGWSVGWTAAAAELTTAKNVEQEGDSTKWDVTDQPQAALEKQAPSMVMAKALSSQTAFRVYNEFLIQSALQHHKEASDSKSVQALEVELAISKFTSHEYVMAARLLTRCRQNYIARGWYGSQSAILVVLAQCFKQLHEYKEFVDCSLQLVACARTSSIEAPGRTRTTPQVPSRVMLDIVEASKRLDQDYIASLDHYVGSVSSEPYIRHLEASDGFSLQISLHDSSLCDLMADEAILQLCPTEENGQQVLRLTMQGPIRLHSKVTRMDLSSHEMYPGLYRIKSISVRLGKIVFEHNNEQTSAVPLFNNMQSLQKPFLRTSVDIRLWQTSRALAFTIDIYEVVDLHHPKSVVLNIDIGENKMLEATARLRAGTAGLRLYTAQAAVIEGDCTITDSSTPGLVSLKGFRNSRSARITVPFQTDYDVKQIFVHTEINYKTRNGNFKLGQSHSLSVVLPLGVNVQDMFKEKVLFSRFSVSSSSGIPLRVLDFELKDGPKYDTCGQINTASNVPVFSRQPASITCKIVQKAGMIQSEGEHRRLRFKVSYKCLDEEILAASKHELISALANTSYHKYEKLLVTHFHKILVSQSRKQDLEPIALLREIGVAPYQEIRWGDAISCLSLPERAMLKAWLHEWHDRHQSIVLPSEAAEVPLRTIDIPVEIPPMHIVHIATLTVAEIGNSTIWHVGDALPANLSVGYTTRWSQSATTVSSRLTFSYEIDANPDTWIVGGQRRGCFSASEGEDLNFVVLLLPQRPGHLLLPTLDIRLLNGPEDSLDLSYEVDYRSQGKTMLVMPGIVSPTVGMRLVGDRRTWLSDATCG